MLTRHCCRPLYGWLSTYFEMNTYTSLLGFCWHVIVLDIGTLIGLQRVSDLLVWWFQQIGPLGRT